MFSRHSRSIPLLRIAACHDSWLSAADWMSSGAGTSCSVGLFDELDDGATDGRVRGLDRIIPEHENLSPYRALRYRQSAIIRSTLPDEGAVE